jgi:hypothetical protein
MLCLDTDGASISLREQNLVPSERGPVAAGGTTDENDKRITFMSGISYYGVLAVTVTEDTVNRRHFEKFLKSRLGSGTLQSVNSEIVPI